MNLTFVSYAERGGILRTSLLPMTVVGVLPPRGHVNSRPNRHCWRGPKNKNKNVFPNNVPKKYAHNTLASGWRTGRCGARDGQNGSSERLQCTRVRDAPRRQHVWRRLQRTPIPTGPVCGSISVESCARARNNYRLAGRAELPEPLTTRVPVAGPPRNPRPFGFRNVIKLAPTTSARAALGYDITVEEYYFFFSIYYKDERGWDHEKCIWKRFLPVYYLQKERSKIL